jgi:hypothetical protein
MNKLRFFFLHAFMCTAALGCNHISRNTDEPPQKWYIELNSQDIGLVRSFMSFEFKDSSFTAYSRKHALSDILGAWKSGLARLFTNDFKHGALLNISHGITRHRGDTLVLAGIFQSAIGNYYFNGRMLNGALTGTLTAGNKAIKGVMTGSLKLPALLLSNYSQLVEQALKKRDEKIFNTRVLATEACRDFDGQIRKIAMHVKDDVEMEFAFYYYAGKLPFSHFSLMRPTLADEAKESGKVPARQVSLEERSPATAYMKISSFGGTAAEIDSMFSIVIQKKYRNLVVDLRSNSGGHVEPGMQFARWVVDSTLYGGVFLTHKWFAGHSALPQQQEYSRLPHFTESNFDLIIEGIHEQEGLCLKVIPKENNYRGKLFILTNGVTASTCEPIVYSLKQQGRAVVVGEKTAGAMLTGEMFPLVGGYSLMVPTADYYTSDGYRIDRKGVIPSIEIKQEKALDYVMELIGKEQAQK